VVGAPFKAGCSLGSDCRGPLRFGKPDSVVYRSRQGMQSDCNQRAEVCGEVMEGGCDSGIVCESVVGCTEKLKTDLFFD
jgi:hypothetical protein